jgi:WD40 repeat protein
MESIIDTFGQYRLLTFDRDPASRSPTVEVAHEALLGEWGRLRQWLAEDREFLLWQQRLRAALHQWQTSGQDEGALLRGAPLAEAENWFNQRRDELSQAEQAFIQASLALRERRAAEQEAQRQRELEAAQRLAEAEHRRAEEQSRAATKLRQRAVWLAGALVVAGLLAVTAVMFGRQASQNAQTAQAEANTRATAQANAEMQQKEAEKQARLATSRELAAAAVKNLEVDPELSILLALQAITTTYAADDGLALPEALDALHQALPASRARLTLAGHTDVVYGGLFSPDETRLATSDINGVSKVWDAATGHELFTLPGGDAAFSLDDGGKRLVTVSAGQVTTITTWEVASGRAISTVPVQVDTEEKGFLLSPDWTRLTVSDPDGTISVWDATTSAAQPKPLFQLIGHTDEIRDMAFSPDGTRWATASNDGTARIWEASTGKLLFTSTGYTHEIHGVTFSPDGHYLATFGDGIVKIWDIATGEEQFNFIAGGSGDIAFSPDGLHIATSQDTTVNVRDLTAVFQGKLLPALKTDVTDAIENQTLWLEGHTGYVLNVVFNSDGTRLISMGFDGTARVWDISPAGAKEWLTLAGHTGNWTLDDVEFSPDGTRLVTANFDLTARVWDAITGQELLTLAGHSDGLYEATFSPDGTRLATASADHTAKIWDAFTGRNLLTLAGHTDLVNDVTFSPDGERLATAGEDHTAKIWDTRTGRELLTLTAHSDFIESVAYSPDGAYLATGSGDNTAKIWDARTGQEIFTLTGHTDTINDVAFNPDGTHLATASFDGSVKIWQTATGQELFTLTRDQYPIKEVAFSSDGTRLAAASIGSRVIVWDILSALETGTARGQELLTLPSGGYTVAFSPDGRLLATGNDTDTTARVYILPIDELLPLAHSRLTRTWTPEECRQYLHVEACPE